MANWRNMSPEARRRVAKFWLDAFNEGVEQADSAHLASMMHQDGYWRDLLGFGWKFKTLHGPAAVQAWLAQAFLAHTASNFRLQEETAAGAIGEHSETLEFFFTFETPIANGRGFVRLIPDPNSPDGAKICTILTSLKELKSFPDPVGRKRVRDDPRAISHGLESWLDQRNAARDFRHRDPEVLIIGAGQSGLMMAARLGQLGITTLIVDKSARVGDVWRKRYRTLRLHNEICMNQFAYMPFPDNWPVFLPKDKLADWLEFYAESMELNIWTETTFLDGTFDENDKQWAVRLRTADGGTRAMRPSHVIMAVGVSGIPNIPEFVGMADFAGSILHSSGDSDHLDVKGKSVLVVGVGTSGHDIAQNMHARGANVTMLQRSPITVVSLDPSSVRAYELYRANDGVRPLADTDMMVASTPYELLAKLHKPLNRRMAEDDRELLDGLCKTGFLLDNDEEDNAGYFLKLLQSQSGYYLNVGASDLIVEGKIKIKSGTGIERLTARQAIFTDGSALDADIVVLATGYAPLQEAVRTMFGDEVAERVGPIWGVGADGELRNMYARTAQPGFYVLGGGFPAARVYSQYTAILIKATLEGLLPPYSPARQTAASSEQPAKPELRHA
ncbi:MAG TPA: NAD(P)-binding domain-containing protein [Xanthobacteraceae bacterium]